jgi:hypothetical protein
MDDTTSDTLDQAGEDILSYTVSDEALEAAAGKLLMSWSLASQTCNPVVYFCR